MNRFWFDNRLIAQRKRSQTTLRRAAPQGRWASHPAAPTRRNRLSPASRAGHDEIDPENPPSRRSTPSLRAATATFAVHTERAINAEAALAEIAEVLGVAIALMPAAPAYSARVLDASAIDGAAERRCKQGNVG
jgi:hypothetical protein